MSSKKRKRESTSKTEALASSVLESSAPITVPDASPNPESGVVLGEPAAMSLNLDPVLSSGWHAIDVALAKCYPGANAAHFAAPLPLAFGGSDPLNAVSAYDVMPLESEPSSSSTDKNGVDTEPSASEDETAPSSHHWHFVTYGFSELFEKSSSNDPEVSGYGFELTMRLACNDTRKIAKKTNHSNSLAVQASVAPPLNACPIWAVEFLQSLARYVFSTNTKFDVGHHLCLNGTLGAPPGGDEEVLGHPLQNNIAAVFFVEDPLLKPMQTPNGTVKFLQVVGVTQDEYELNWETSVPFVSQLISDTFGPLLITRLARPSVLSNPATQAKASHKAQTEGSSHSSLYNRQIEWHITESKGTQSQIIAIQIGANIVSQFLAILKRRLPYGKSFSCIGTDREYPCAITFVQDASEEAKIPESKKSKLNPSKSPSSPRWVISPENDHILQIYLQKCDIDRIVHNLKPVQDNYQIRPNLIFLVVPTYIKDANTSIPIKVIGD
jgi:hypothetical protein